MVSSVTSTSTTAAATNSSTATTAADMQNQFLTLLVAQLQNQDPMSPMDNAQMTSQMAQISTVTGIEKLNDTVNSVTNQFSMQQMMQGTNLIGHTVLAEGNTLAAAGENVYTAAFDLSGSAADVKVQITTPSGLVVDTVNLGNGEAGRNYFTWNASNYSGDASQLRYTVQAANGDSAVNSTSLTPYSVIAASTSNGNLMLELNNGRNIPYSDIKAVY